MCAFVHRPLRFLVDIIIHAAGYMCAFMHRPPCFLVDRTCSRVYALLCTGHCASWLMQQGMCAFMHRPLRFLVDAAGYVRFYAPATALLGWCGKVCGLLCTGNCVSWLMRQGMCVFMHLPLRFLLDISVQCAGYMRFCALTHYCVFCFMIYYTFGMVCATLHHCESCFMLVPRRLGMFVLVNKWAISHLWDWKNGTRSEAVIVLVIMVGKSVNCIILHILWTFFLLDHCVWRW